MKRFLLCLLALWMTASLASCGIDTETTPETALETDPAGTEETAEEVTAEITLGNFPRGKTAKILYNFSWVTMPANTIGDRLLYGALQGLSAKYCEEQILAYSANVGPIIEEKWGAVYTDTVDSQPITLENLAKHYKDMGFIRGYILCDSAKEESMYVAVSLAGITDSIIVTEQNVEMVKALGYECTMDVSDKDDAWLRGSEYWDLLNREIAFETPIGNASCGIDYAVLCGAYYNFYSGVVGEEHDAMYEFLDDNGRVFGFNSGAFGEVASVISLSSHNITLIPTDWVNDLSVTTGFILDKVEQVRGEYDTKVENVHTVAFLWSDGDNLSWTLGGFQGAPWYGDPRQGQIPVNWGISAALIDLNAPTILYLYDKQTANDEFVVELGGLGYTHPSLWTPDARKLMIDDLVDGMERSDMHYVTLLDFGGWNPEVLSDFTEREQIKGVISVGYDCEKGGVIWTNGKPAVGIRGNVGSSDETELFSENWFVLQNLIRESRCTDPTDTHAYSIYYVQAWSATMEKLQSIIGRLDEQVEVVTVGELMERLAANCKPADQ